MVDTIAILDTFHAHFELRHDTTTGAYLEVDAQGILNVGGHVYLKTEVKDTLQKLPVTFGTVTGNFILFALPQLQSLEGSPRHIGGFFRVVNCNKLLSLQGGPLTVGTDYTLDYNEALVSLDGAPLDVPGHFSLHSTTENNTLATLQGGPLRAGKFTLITESTSLLNLVGAPQSDEVYCNCAGLQTLEGIQPFVRLELFQCHQLQTMAHLAKPLPWAECHIQSSPLLQFDTPHKISIYVRGKSPVQTAHSVRQLLQTRSNVHFQDVSAILDTYVHILFDLVKTNDLIVAIFWFENFYGEPFTTPTHAPEIDQLTF